METSSFHRGKPCAWIPTSVSTSSLDVGLLVCAPVQQSLLAESITLDSLSSESSDVPPAFPTLKSPAMRTIGLGDRLQMFSLKGSGMHFNSTVLISTPTIPRLKSMLKECLSISKWVETCAAWRAPGHVPWEGFQETSVESWVPEGSVFSPEYFALAISQSRTSRDKGFPCFERPWPPQLSPRILKSDAVDFASQHSTDPELLDMMHELKNIRSFFQESPRDTQAPQADKPSQLLAAPAKPSLPSLVVSTSQFSFPITLDSSFSLSSSLASRRGKRTPPHLRLKKEKNTREKETQERREITELPYPEIPTAFLGSPSRHCPQFEYSNSNDKPALRFEEMITNLRLQCSTMSLQTPQDTSFNSRSYLESEPVSQDVAIKHAAKKGDGDEWAFAQTLLKDYKFPPPPQILPPPKVNYIDRPRDSAVHHVLHGKTQSAHIVVPSYAHEVKNMDKVINSKSEIYEPGSNSQSHPDRAGNVKSLEPALLRPTSPPSIRSAMARKRISRTRKPLKSVRFVLTPQEVEKINGAASSNVDIKNHVPDRRKASQDSSSTTPQLTRTSSSLSTWRKARSATLSSPLRRSTIFAESEGGNSDRSTFRRSTQSLGRHSLSRIIKGPIFSGRDSKRATVLSMSVPGEMKTDENAVRRESEGGSLNKRSRLPVPLRNILTRFK